MNVSHFYKVFVKKLLTTSTRAVFIELNSKSDLGHTLKSEHQTLSVHVHCAEPRVFGEWQGHLPRNVISAFSGEKNNFRWPFFSNFYKKTKIISIYLQNFPMTFLAVAETWRQVWGDRKKFRGPRYLFFRKKCPFSRHFFSRRPGFSDFTFL